MLVQSDWQLQADSPVQIGDSWEGKHFTQICCCPSYSLHSGLNIHSGWSDHLGYTEWTRYTDQFVHCFKLVSDSPDTPISAICINMTNALTISATWMTERDTLTDTPRMLDSSCSYHPRKTYIGHSTPGSTDRFLPPNHCLTSGPQETFARCSSKGKELS